MLPPRSVIELKNADVSGLKRRWKIERLVAELDGRGATLRELGYDDLGRLIHRWPGGDSLADRGLLDLAVFDQSTPSEISADAFADLWVKAVEEEEFFADHDRMATASAHRYRSGVASRWCC